MTGDTDEAKRGGGIVIVAMASLAMAVHLVVNAASAYGYSRDELYYLACADHPAAGYVDHPPFSILVLAMVRMLFGDSLFAIRLPAAVAGAAVVALTGLLARELGAGRRGVFFACLAVLVSPVHLGLTTVFSMNAFDMAFWPAAAFVLVRLIKTGRAGGWLLLGAILGLGLLNKASVLWLGAGIAVAILVVRPLRRQLRTVWPYVAGAEAFLLFAPYVVWNAQHGFPHLEFMRNALSGKYAGLTPLSFLAGSVLLHQPLTLPLWLGGFLLLFLKRTGHPGQRHARLAIGSLFATVLAILLLNYHSKPEYLAPAMALAFAAGGLAIEDVSTGWRSRLTVVYAGLLILGGLVAGPYVLPILPVPTYVAYARFLRFAPSSSEGHRLRELPQHWADMFGWEEKVRDVARVYWSLDAAERERTAVFSSNYGRCGAIDLFGPRYGLPRAIGGHNSYWLWGPRDYTGEIVIVLGGAIEPLQGIFESVEIVGISSCRDCIPYEDELPIYMCRRSKRPLPELWPLTKQYG